MLPGKPIILSLRPLRFLIDNQLPGALRHKTLGLICSQRCPGDVILKPYDFARLVRDSGIAKIGRDKSRVCEELRN